MPVEEVMNEYSGEQVSQLRKLASALACNSIFGKDALRAGSLRGGRQSKTQSLNKVKLNYIKTVIRTRVPNLSPIEFEAIWEKCHTTISKMPTFATLFKEVASTLMT